MAPCKFFNTPRGCNKGDACTFAHERAPGSSGSGGRAPFAGRGGRASFAGRGGGRGAGRGPYSPSGGGFMDNLLTELGCSVDPEPLLVQRFVQLALQQCAGGAMGASQVLASLRRDDGSCFLRALGQQLTRTQDHKQLLGALVPLLKLLSHEDIRGDPTQANPVFATLHESISLAAVSAALDSLAQQPGADADGFIRSQLQQRGGMVMPCNPKDWLDVLHSLATYLQEVTTRFSSSLQQNLATLEGANALMASMASAAQQHLPATGSVAQSRATDWRRLISRLTLLQQQLSARQEASKVVEQLQAMQAQLEARQKQQGAAAADAGAVAGPGELCASGPRHDNDRVSHLDISVAPTAQEVLCTTRPFLPANRPGTVPHAAHDPDRAHRELHFRLLRHDVIGPVCDAAQAFLQFGGVAGLKGLKNSTPGFSVRLHLQSGRGVQDMYVFRNVSILSLTSTYNGSIAYRIEFDDAPQLANADMARRRDFWKHTKQLAHGSLVALWWDGDTPDNPHIMFATVSDRDEKLLAAQGEPRQRPQLGIRMCGLPVTAELMAAVLGRQRLGGKKEVVLLPAAGGFFAYEPILKALQTTHPLPLARYLLHGQAASGGGLPALLHGELVGGIAGTGGGAVQVPAYGAGADCLYDLTPVASKEKVQDLSTDELHRLERVCISSPEGIPLDLLMKATTLDASQAAALAACLTRELAVVQGPPGCGKTFIGVQLVRVLLANTRSSADSRPTPESISSRVPQSQRPEIGPILVLCYTNHALDSFLLDLLHCGITKGIIRVGRRSSAPELEPYNLTNQEGGRARGPEVGRCRKRVEDLRQQVNDKLLRVQTSRTARRLQWDDVHDHLQHTRSQLLDSFIMRGSLMADADFLQAATADPEDGFMPAPSRRRGRRGMQQQWGGGGWVFGADPLQDWLASSPLQDWQRQQWMLQQKQQWEQWEQGASAGTPTVNADHMYQHADSSSASSHSSSAGNAQGPGQVEDGVHSGSRRGRAAAAGSSNPFEALAALGEGSGEAEDFETLLAQLESGDTAATAATTATAATAQGGSSRAEHKPQAAAAYSEWLMLSTAGALASSNAAAAARGTDADRVSDDGWELAELSGDEGQHDSSSVGQVSTQGLSDAAAADDAALANVAQPAAGATAAGPTGSSSSSRGTGQQRPPVTTASGTATGVAAAAAREAAAAAAAAADAAAADAAAAEEDNKVPAEVQAVEASDRSVEQLLQLEDVSSMSRLERQRLYQHWLNTLANKWGSDLDHLISELEQEQKTLQGLYDRASLEVLRSARIVGMTTTGLANKQGLLHALGPKVVIVEEAAEVLEAHILTSLAPSVEHLVLIGDHLQLPPKVEVYELQKESGRGFDLNKSMFERLVEAGTVQHVTLQQQRRMRPEISQLIRGPLYPELKDHPAVTTYPTVKGMVNSLFFWDHDFKEGGTDQSKSRFNDYEVYACLGLARYLLQQGYGGNEQPDICILTPYVGQLLKLRRELAAVAGLRFVMSEKDSADLANVITDAGAAEGSFDPQDASSSNSSNGGSGSGGIGGSSGGSGSSSAGGGSSGVSGSNKVITLGTSIRLATIDNFQGEEARIIILSLVRNPREAGAGIGFLAVNNRINVLLSRAKEGMYLVGSSTALQAAAEKAMAAGRPCMWAPVLDHLSAEGCLGKTLQVCCQRHGNVTDVTHHKEFASLVGDGGCQRSCGLKLPCGHTCPRRCHADDPSHSQTKCLKQCGRLCARGRHPCELLCHQPCSACHALEESVQLPCGHTASNVPCFKAGEPEKIHCSELVTVTYPGCGHELTVQCSRSTDYKAGTAPCSQQVTVTLPACGHTVTLPCGKAALALLDPSTCTQACGGLLPGCAHTCSSKCGQCMQLLFTGPPAKAEKGSAAGEAAAAAEKSFAEAFLHKLQASQPGLYTTWSEWKASTKQHGSLGQLWQRCLKDLIAKKLGTQQCSLLATQGDSSSTNSSGSGSASLWTDYNSCRSSSTSKGPEERLAAEWQAQLLALNSSSSTTTASSSSSSGSNTAAGVLQRPHKPCSKVCDKPLACGHSCKLKCHFGSSCGPCQQACSIGCEHAACHQACAAPCAPCAEPCSWFCEHKGPCLLPCGVPCDREPCNRRCSNLLGCGHRCPGLCGECCLPRKFCVHPSCMAKASAEVKDRVVDMVMFKKFGELTDADATADPLILLRCGHLFCTSTLDGHMCMSEAYERLPANASSSSSSTNTSSAPAAGGSSGGPGGSSASSSSGGGGPGDSSSSSASSSAAAADVASDLDNWGAPVHRNDFPPPKSCPDCRAVVAGVHRYGRVVLHSQLGVTQRKHAEAIRCTLASSRQKLAHLQRSLLSPNAPWRDSTTLAAADRLIKSKKLLAPGMLSRLIAGQRAAWDSGEEFKGLIRSAKRPPKLHVMESYKASLLSAVRAGKLDKATARQRFEALKTCNAKPDMQQAFEAMQSHASTMQLCLTLDTQQLEALTAALEAVDTALGRESAQEGLGLDEGARGHGRRAAYAWLAQQKRDLTAHVHRVLGQAQGLFAGAVQDVRWATDAAAKDASYTTSYRLSHSLMMLLVERARQLQPLKKPIIAHIAGRQGKQQHAAESAAQEVWKQQQQLIQEAEAAGNAALQLQAVHKQQLVCNADNQQQREMIANAEHADVEAVKELMEKLKDIREQLNGQLDAAEVAAVLGALMQAEGHYYSNLGLASFMAGHLYECPNGHLFVIGECGGNAGEPV